MKELNDKEYWMIKKLVKDHGRVVAMQVLSAFKNYTMKEIILIVNTIEKGLKYEI